MEHMKYEFGDERMNMRAERCFEKILTNPGLSFPKAFEEPAELEAFYRFLHNERTYLDSLKQSLLEDTRSRIKKNAKEILAIHDTSEFKPPKSGSIGPFSKDGKFLGHVTLLTDFLSPGYVYGVGEVSLWNRVDGYDKEILDNDLGSNEADRWWDQVVRTNSEWSESDLIHVMDREGDASKIWSRLRESGCRFVLRVCHDRQAKNASTEEVAKLFESMKAAPVLMEKEVPISTRKHAKKAPPKSKKRHPDREERLAHVEISAQVIHFYKTNAQNHRTNETVEMNVVYVFERGWEKDPIEWCLMTSEPIGTKEEILKVIDIYKSRWMIEEFFHGLKTGCRLEDRMFADEGAWYRLVIFLLPIVTRILNMRYQLNHPKDRRHAIDLTTTQWQVLKKLGRRKSRNVKNLATAYNEICRLGGHIKSNGPPGWKVILRGYITLLEYEQGWLLATEDVIST